MNFHDYYFVDNYMKYQLDGLTFDSNTGNNAKYVVKYNGKKIYFGDKRYQQYFDKIGHYNKLNHYDNKRRKRYRERHKNDNFNDPNYADGLKKITTTFAILRRCENENHKITKSQKLW